MTLHMVQARVDVRRAASRVARDHPGGKSLARGDLGFIVKTALTEAFGGQAAPRPWHIQRTDGRGTATVIGYTGRDGDALRAQLGFAEPEMAEVIPAGELHAAPVPSLAAGQRLHASLTCHPTRHSRHNGSVRSERDAYLIAVDRAEAEGRRPESREAVYTAYVRERLAPGFTVDSAQLTGFSIPRVVRKRRDGRLTPFQLPVCHLDLSLTVADVEAAHQVLAQGVGRGKAYGCGMLRVRPA